MNTYLALPAAILIATAGHAQAPADNTAQRVAMQSESPTTEQKLAYAEENLADYNYANAAYWAYELKRQGVALPAHLQQVLDEEDYDPEAPVSTASIFWLSSKRLSELTAKAENGDTRAAKRLYQYYLFSTNNPQAGEYWRKKAGIVVE